MSARAYRAGESLDDFCRACKTDRVHTVIAVDADARPIRVSCGYCHSDHNYRGGPRVSSSGAAPRPSTASAGAARATSGHAQPDRFERSEHAPFPVVSDRERTAPPIMAPSDACADLELLLRRVIREEGGLTPVAPAEKWRGGTLVLRPGAPGLQERTWPIETFFHKVVMLRNRLRTIEQQINASDLPDDVKVKLQSHVSGCYGSLTSFNVLFADDEDHFRGSGGE